MKTNQHCAGGWRWFAVTCAAMIAILILAGCVGVRTGGERAARKNQQTIEKIYRPGDQRPTLPTLRTNSPLGDFLLFEMLNQPQVEAAYYDYQELGQVVVPAFYQQRDDWPRIMRHAIALNASHFNTQRMVQEYIVKAYFQENDP